MVSYCIFISTKFHPSYQELLGTHDANMNAGNHNTIYSYRMRKWDKIVTMFRLNHEEGVDASVVDLNTSV
jgi:hypothetical protein